MLTIVLWAAAASAAGMCGEQSVQDVEQAMVALHDAYDIVDEAGFDRATKNLDAAVSCLDDVPPPSTLARLHQAYALVSFVSGRIKASRRSLAAARLVDPGWKLAHERFPDGHPYRELWAGATDPGSVEDIGSIAPSSWIVDGYERGEAPIDRAFLLQVRRDDAIAWTGYLWTFDEIPDRGQNRTIDPSVTPRTWSVGLLGVGRAVFSRQLGEPGAGWGDQRASAVGGGLGAMARFTPNAFIGGELTAAGLGPDDAVNGGRVGREAKGVLLIGSAVVSGRGQAHASARLGAAADQFRAWGNAPWGLQDDSWTVIAASVGLEGGWRSPRGEVLLTADYLLAAGTVPYELQTRLQGGVAVSDDLALQGALGVHRGGLPFVDDNGESVGRRSDLDVRLGLGVALWL